MCHVLLQVFRKLVVQAFPELVEGKQGGDNTIGHISDR